MLKRLIERFFKKKCCKSFKNFRQVVINTFSRWLSKPFSKSSRPKLLTDCIKQGRKNFEEKSFTEELRTRLSYTYVPSVKSFGYIVASVFLVWGIGEIFEKLSGIESPFPNITAVHAGIGVVIFALVIFVAESLRDNEAKDKARVLLKVSYLFPLVVAEIIVFFILLWGRDNGFGEAFIVSVIGLFTLYSLARIINVLLSKRKFDEQRINLLQERLRQHMEIALKELLDNKVLSSELGDSNIKLCTPSSLDFEYYSEYRRLIDYLKDYYFYAKKNGIIADINFNELTKVSNLMGELKVKSVTDKEDNPEPYSSGFIFQNDIQVSSNAYLMKGFHDVIDEKDRELICIHKDLVAVNKKKLKKIKKHIDKAFIIKQQDHFMQEVRDEISGIKDEFISAIVNKQLDQIDRLSNLYIHLADSFSEYIEKYNETHLKGITKQELANKVEQSIWFSKSFRDVFNQTMESHDTGIIRKVDTLARIMSSRAIEKDNYNLFQEFIRFPEWLYHSAVKEKNEQLKKLLIERSWQYLASIYRIIDHPRDDGNIEEAPHIQKYADDILVIFHILLKRAFDYKDLNSFNKFQQIVENLFVKNVLQKLTFSSEQPQEISKRYNQMSFGLASWILHLLDRESNNEKNQFLNIKNNYKNKEFYKSICSFFPLDIDDFTTDFSTIWRRNINYGELGYSEIDSTYVLGDIQKFYIVHLLFLLKDKDEKSIENIKLPADLESQANSLIHTLDRIKNDPDGYRFVLGKVDTTKIDLLKQKFSNK